MPLVHWIRRLAFAGVLICLLVVVLGAYVRLTAAGLGCPDWPGCYGHVTPLGVEPNASAPTAYPGTPLDLGKAWREMIHRYAATSLGLIIVAIVILSFAGRTARPLSLALLVTVLVQGTLGMLTVTQQLKPLIVTAHLLFGLTTLSLLWYLSLSQGESADADGAMSPHRQAGRPSWYPTRYRVLLWVGFVALAVQIALGGWMSSNYAAIACPDFPTCQARWWPDADFHAAFILWRGARINFEGGVLDNSARVAIHLAHRMGAVIAAVTLSTAALAFLMGKMSPRVSRAAGLLLLALGLQLTIGISLVLKGFPLWLGTAHTAGAALLLLSTLYLLWVTAQPDPADRVARQPLAAKGQSQSRTHTVARPM